MASIASTQTHCRYGWEDVNAAADYMTLQTQQHRGKSVVGLGTTRGYKGSLISMTSLWENSGFVINRCMPLMTGFSKLSLRRLGRRAEGSEFYLLSQYKEAQHS